MKEAVLGRLGPEYPWKAHFHHFSVIDSTNDRLKAMAREGAPHGTVLLAEYQTGGHGRLGRSFHSPEGVGVYMSILLRPDCAPTELMHLTCATAVAMCDAVERACGFRPGIKWTNDLVSGKRKLGGILTELGFSSKGTLDFCLVGIGINCCQKLTDFPEAIQSFAGSLAMVSGQVVDRSAVAAAMMEALWEMDQNLLTGRESTLARYRGDCVTVGQEISLVRGEEIRHGKALDVDPSGALVVAFSDGHREAVNSGEVSIRGMYGYI